MEFLIVDDSRAMRMISRRTLRQAGFGGHPVREAEDGVKALQEVSSKPPDVVLCDWNMPNMSGIELLEALRTRGFRGVFGFITSSASSEMRQLAGRAGANFLIGKPYSAEDLRLALKGAGADGSAGSRLGAAGARVRGLDPHSVGVVLSGLLDRQVKVNGVSRSVVTGSASTKAVAIYGASANEVGGACVCELELAVLLAAALSRLPKRMALEVASSGVLPANLKDNAHEVFNVFGRLIGGRNTLQVLEIAGAKLRPEVVQLVSQKARLLHVAIDVPGYGKGSGSFLAL